MRVSIIALAAALAAGPSLAQTPPAPTPTPDAAPPEQKVDPVSPEQTEQEPRPADVEQERLRAQSGRASAAGVKPPSAAGMEKGEAPKWDVSNPPGPFKNATIDVTSGTWMSVDVSPDGKEIVFDLLGDIYVMPIGGGEARAIASGMSWDMQPRYSPNGRWIAFTSDRGGGDNIWVMDRNGGNPRQVTKETFRLLNQPDWTPDSEYIVARKHFTGTRSLGAGEMWMYHRSGGDGVQLTKRRTQQKDTNEPAFSPDGRYLYFSDDATPGDIFEYDKDPNSQIYVIQRLDRETGDLSQYVAGPGGSVRPTPSPDGKSLAFIRRVRFKSVLYILDLESGAETPIYDGLDRDMQEIWSVQGLYPGMSWTPDGKTLVFWAGGKIRRIDVASRQVADIPFHVRDTRRIQQALRTKVEVAPKTFDVKMLRWAETSPKGDKVVYEALGHLWVRDLPNGTPRRLTRQTDHFELYPSWSRDGKSIVYTTWNDEAHGSIRVVSASGGEGRKVTSKPGDYIEPVFSPDGATIAYRTASDGFLRSALWARETGIYTIPAKGGAPSLVTRKGVLPQFGARNDRLFFMTFEDEGKRALKSMEIDGGGERTHLMTAAAAEFAVSPDEKWVAWTERFNAYVMPFANTGKAVDVSPEAKGLPINKVTRDAGEWLHWSGDSRMLHWSLGPELYTRDLRQSFAFLDGAPATPAPAPEHGVNIGFSQPYDAPAGRVAFTGARVITMRGDEVIEDGVVVLNGNRIEQVGARGAISVPADAKVFDVSGKTIIPGLIDAHWHGAMGSDEIIPQQSWVDYAALAYGVTTIHDPSNDTSEIFAHSELAKAGLVTAPRIFSTGTILYGATTAYTAKIDSLDDALGHLRRMKAVGAFSVKSYNQPRREQRQQIIEAGRQLGMMVVPEGGALYQINMTMIADGHSTIEHSLPVAAVYDDVLQYWPQSDTRYTPTLIVAFGGLQGENYWYQKTNVWEDPILTQYVPRRVVDARSRRRTMVPENEFNHFDVSRIAKALSDRGVPVQSGAHGQRESLGLHWEMAMMVQGGMTPMEALRTATVNPAKNFGFDQDLGTVEAGKLADLVILDADPRADIANAKTVRFTVANGRVYDTGMNEVGTRVRERRPFFFQEAGGEVTSPAATDSYTHGED